MFLSLSLSTSKMGLHVRKGSLIYIKLLGLAVRSIWHLYVYIRFAVMLS